MESVRKAAEMVIEEVWSEGTKSQGHDLCLPQSPD